LFRSTSSTVDRALLRDAGNLGQDIECSVFGIIEMNYTSGPINRLNFKGLLKSDGTSRVTYSGTSYSKEARGLSSAPCRRSAVRQRAWS